MVLFLPNLKKIGFIGKGGFGGTGKGKPCLRGLPFAHRTTAQRIS